MLGVLGLRLGGPEPVLTQPSAIGDLAALELEQKLDPGGECPHCVTCHLRFSLLALPTYEEPDSQNFVSDCFATPPCICHPLFSDHLKERDFAGSSWPLPVRAPAPGCSDGPRNMSTCYSSRSASRLWLKARNGPPGYVGLIDPAIPPVWPFSAKDPREMTI